MVETRLLDQETPTLPKDAAKHLKVLRPEDGEPIELFDGRGHWRVYVCDGQGLRARSDCRTIEKPDNALTLFACVTKGSRWDWTIEKATELGVTRIVPVISDRTIVRIPKAERAAKRERWLRIAEDAARQSDAKWMPEIPEAVDFRDSLALVKDTMCFIGALTNPPPPSLAAATTAFLEKRTVGPHSLAAYVGPEGDFTPDELAALMQIATPTSFGPTVLRAETAAIFAVTVLRALSDRQAESGSLT